MADEQKGAAIIPIEHDGTFNPELEKEFGQHASKMMQELMAQNPQVIAKIVTLVKEEAAAGSTTMPIRRIFKTLRTELPADQWDKIAGPMMARDEKAPKVGEAAPDFNLPIMGTEEMVRLSGHAGKEAVAIIFGNYT